MQTSIIQVSRSEATRSQPQFRWKRPGQMPDPFQWKRHVGVGQWGEWGALLRKLRPYDELQWSQHPHCSFRDALGTNLTLTTSLIKTKQSIEKEVQGQDLFPATSILREHLAWGMLALVLKERKCKEMGRGHHLYLVYLFIEPLCLLTSLVSRALSTEAYCKVHQVKSL